jgi:hypothetical protein
MTEILRPLNSRAFLSNSLDVSRCICCNQKALVDVSGMSRTQMGTHSRTEIAAVQ